MSDIKVVHIGIAGAVQTGKSSVLASIEALLLKHGYCVAIPNRQERNGASEPIESAAPHEIPDKDRTVFVLTETTYRTKQLQQEEG